MQSSLSDYRQLYGEVYIAETPDGIVVPFKLLSLGDYFKYTSSLNSNLIVASVIEDEIFCKCVQDEVLVQNIDKQKAGTVTIIVKTILQTSAPNSPDEFEYLFNINREAVNHTLHLTVRTICLAFPAYTPDDIYKMDIQDIMFRLAQAERKLIDTGFLKEPLAFFEEVEPQKKPKQKKSKIDTKKLQQAFEEQSFTQPREPPKIASAKNSVVVEEESYQGPRLRSENGDTVVSLGELVRNLDSDVTANSPEERQMLRDAKLMYRDQLERLKKGEKIKIAPHEQRVEEGRKRLEANRKKLQEKLRKSRDK